VQQKHALGGPSAACLLPHVAPLQQQLLAFLARDGLKAKHLLPPLKLEALQLKHPEATSRGAVGGQCRKLQALDPSYPYPYPYPYP